MVTVTLCLLACGALVFDAEVHRRLATIFGKTVRRCDIKLEWLATALGVPRPKLSDQLAGKVPFTYMWRFFVSTALRREYPEFREELLDLLAEDIDRALITPDLAFLIRGRKKMARASLPEGPITRLVTLPLGQEDRDDATTTAETHGRRVIDGTGVDGRDSRRDHHQPVRVSRSRVMAL